MEKSRPKWGGKGMLLLSGVLLGIFAYFGLRYYWGEAGGFPFFSTAAAWVECTLGQTFGGGA